MPSANPTGDAPPSATDSASPPVSVVLAQPPSPRPASADLVGERLLAILRAPLRGDETVAAGFARKEQELRFVLASMSSMDARHLYKRLTIPQDGDVLVATFARLTVERRTRLLAFIADARRREAIAAARR